MRKYMVSFFSGTGLIFVSEKRREGLYLGTGCIFIFEMLEIGIVNLLKKIPESMFVFSRRRPKI